MFNLLAAEMPSYVIYIVLGVVFVGMMLMTIIPQRKQKKRMQEMMSSLSVGDKIMTIGGFVGSIVEINTENDRFTVNIGDETTPVNVVIVRNAIRTFAVGFSLRSFGSVQILFLPVFTAIIPDTAPIINPLTASTTPKLPVRLPLTIQNISIEARVYIAPTTSPFSAPRVLHFIPSIQPSSTLMTLMT